MTFRKLNCAVKEYEVKLTALKNLLERDDRLSSDQILKVILARDAVHAAMSDKKQLYPGRLIKKVNELDESLKECAKSAHWAEPLTDLQSIFNPPKKQWWWLLEPITPKPWWDRYDWLFRLLTLILLTISLSFAIDISNRFVSGGINLLGTFVVAVSSVLTLLAGGGALTKTGQETIEYILTSISVKKHWWDETICFFSLLLCLCMFFLSWKGLPCLADKYINDGNDAYYNKHQYSIAEGYYNLALKLDPENTKVHYKLGNLYREMHDIDKALENYKLAMKNSFSAAADLTGLDLDIAADITGLYIDKKDYTQADKWLREAIKSKASNNQNYTINDKQYKLLHNLSRAYLEQKKYNEAISWLTLGRQGAKGAIDEKKRLKYLENVADPKQKNYWQDLDLQETDEKEKLYTMLYYLGWVRLKQKRADEAKPFLEEAINLKNEEAPAHCLLAQVLEQKDQPAEDKWEQCLSHADQNIPDEDTWIGLARKSQPVEGE